MCSELPTLPVPQNNEHRAAQDLARAADRFACSLGYGQLGRLQVTREVARALDALEAKAHERWLNGETDWDTDEELFAQAARADKVRALAEQLLLDVFNGYREVSTNTSTVLEDVALHGLGGTGVDGRFVRRGEWMTVTPDWFTVVSVSNVTMRKL